MQKKHIFNILKQCPNLKVRSLLGAMRKLYLGDDNLMSVHVRLLQSLELLDCRALTLSGWPRDAVALREVYLNGCNFVTNQAASSLIKVCGSTLEKVVLTGMQPVDTRC